jgi:hypothetical protein
MELRPSAGIEIGQAVSCLVSWTNTLSVPIENVILEIEAGDGLSLVGTPTADLDRLEVGTMPPGSSFARAVEFVAVKRGDHAFHTRIQSIQLGLSRSTEVVSVGSLIELSIRHQDDAIDISFDSVAGEIYRLEYQEDLGTDGWLHFGEDVEATGSKVAFSDISGGRSKQCFYRVRVLGR